MSKIRVLIVDDSPFIHKAISRALTNGDFEVCGIGSNGKEGAELYAKLKPDLVTMDITNKRAVHRQSFGPDPSADGDFHRSHDAIEAGKQTLLPASVALPLLFGFTPNPGLTRTVAASEICIAQAGKADSFNKKVYRASLLSNTSPHSGQNFGGLALSSGSHPHLSQRYAFAPSGLLAPHSAQNFPLLTLPQAAHVQPSDGSGFGAPQSAQNLPVFTWPQPHFQLSAAGCAAACWAEAC